MDLKKFIRDVPDFPKKGIVFKDISPLLQSGEAFRATISGLADFAQGKNISKICGIESRGFIFGAALAERMGVGFVPVRKKGKLPWTKYAQEYLLEYGSDSIEIHIDAVEKGENVLVVDDVLATGGTARAVCDLLSRTGSHIAGLAFVIELGFLEGMNQLKGYNVHSLIQYG